MSRRPIRVMPAELALKIAAGEVVERPASAVKELIDNAIDAGASSVKVEVREAGLKLIRVTDNGCGIPRREVALAFTSHATSKILDLEDLQHLTTLGFRGEALPSIAAVSRVEVQTQAGEEAVGTRFDMEFGRPGAQRACSAPQGTRIAVMDLFSNVPARRKFVRSLRAEASHIQSVVMQYTLAQPGIRFALTLDERPAFTSPGTGHLEDAVAAVFGPDVGAALHPFQGQDQVGSLTGLLSAPQLSRQNRSAIHIAVNGRPVANRSLGFALEEAYSGFLMTGRHPVAVVHLSLPPEDVDANIHPSKSEVRFAQDRGVHALLHRAAASALLDLRVQARELSPGADGLSTVQVPDAAHPSLISTGGPDGEDELPGLHMPALRVFGQANQTFIIAEGPAGLYMIDQHAAHERILFDQLDEQIAAGGAATQPLLDPVAVDLTPNQLLALEDYSVLLTRMGFVLEPFGDGACLVRALPALVHGRAPIDLVTEVLTELETLPEPTAARERALAALACRAAVKAGQTLDVQEIREIVHQLEQTARPSTCPHGRPTMIHLSHSQLEREFGRR